MTREEGAYLAGIIDGEGCLSVTSNLASGQRFIPYLSIVNTSEELMSRLHELIGGGSVQRKKGKKDYYKDCFVLTVRSNKLREILPLVIDFLIVKREQGQLVLSLLQLINQHGKGYFWSRNPDRLEQCSLIASTLHKLNKRSKEINKEE